MENALLQKGAGVESERTHFNTPRTQIKNGTSPNFPVSAVKTAPENDLLYDPFGIGNDDDLELALSIQTYGVREPLVLSCDGYLLSGHRRLGAAKRLGLETVPVRVIDVVFANLSKSERLAALKLHNQQREKTPGERIREELAAVDPSAAYETLKRHRAQQLDNIAVNIALGAAKKRSKITTLQFLQAAQQVIDDNREWWPLTVRRIHYLLLNDPPLKHDSKPDSIYANDRASYKALTNLLARARLVGCVPMRAIEDSTRPIQLGGGFPSVQTFIKQETENFLLGYSRNLMQGQPQHVEIMLEKNALRPVIEKVARDYCIPVTTGRGYSSLSPRYDLFARFRDSGKKRLILLMLTDFDPDGEEIAASFARSLRDDFGLRRIDPIKVALTAEDVEKYHLPSDMDAKPASPNYAKFFEQYGGKAVELDACPVDLIQNKLREAIESIIDVAEFNAQVALEKSDAAQVAAYRRIVLQTIAGRGV